MIYNRRMYHSRDGFAPTAYTGASPHTEHVHFEGAWTQAADNNQTFDYRLEEIPVPLTPNDITAIARAVWEYDADRFTAGTQTAAGMLLTENRRSNATTNQQLPDLARAVAALAAQLNELTGKDFTDEAAIVTGVLAGLSPAAIAAAIPPTMASDVADELAARLAARPRSEHPARHARARPRSAACKPLRPPTDSSPDRDRGRTTRRHAYGRDRCGKGGCSTRPGRPLGRLSGACSM